jgi:hypothetical protein
LYVNVNLNVFLGGEAFSVFLRQTCDGMLITDDALLPIDLNDAAAVLQAVVNNVAEAVEAVVLVYREDLVEM